MVRSCSLERRRTITCRVFESVRVFVNARFYTTSSPHTASKFGRLPQKNCLGISVAAARLSSAPAPL
jgi:hypothetical protein